MADSLLGGIVINEILVDPNGALNFDTDGNGTASAVDEFVELYNSAATAIDISGLQLWDAGVGNWFTFPPGTILQPGAHAMVMTGLQPGGSYPAGAPGDLFFDAGRGAALINNGGDNVVVYDPANDAFIQAAFNGDAFDDPTLGLGGYSGFSATATQSGSGEDFGADTDGQSLQRLGDGTDSFVSDTPTPGTTNVCFVGGTCIQTPSGAMPVERIGVGDLVITADRGARPVAWVFNKAWTPRDIRERPTLAPVRIRMGALGPGLPVRDLLVSQQHRVLVQGRIARRIFLTDEVLVPAKFLLPLPGVDLVFPDHRIAYFHVMLSRHEILIAEGVWTESLYLGREATNSIPPAALAEIAEILDLPSVKPGACPFEPARPLVQGGRARVLISRHLKNHKPVAVAA